MWKYPIRIDKLISFRDNDTDMAFARQIVDILITGIIAGTSSFLVSEVSPNISITIGVALACIYYFSRCPWGSRHGIKYNEKIDEMFDTYLPF